MLIGLVVITALIWFLISIRGGLGSRVWIKRQMIDYRNQLNIFDFGSGLDKANGDGDLLNFLKLLQLFMNIRACKESINQQLSMVYYSDPNKISRLQLETNELFAYVNKKLGIHVINYESILEFDQHRIEPNQLRIIPNCSYPASTYIGLKYSGAAKSTALENINRMAPNIQSELNQILSRIISCC